MACSCENTTIGAMTSTSASEWRKGESKMSTDNSVSNQFYKPCKSWSRCAAARAAVGILFEIRSLNLRLRDKLPSTRPSSYALLYLQLYELLVLSRAATAAWLPNPYSMILHAVYPSTKFDKPEPKTSRAPSARPRGT